MGMGCVSWWTWPSRTSNLPPVRDEGGRPMARRTFDVIDVTEILMHWHAGRSKNEMAASLGVDRKTLRKYIAPAEAAGIVRGGPSKTAEEWAELVRGWFRPLAGPGHRQAAHGVGVCDGAGVLAAHVRAAGAEDGSAGLDRVPCGGV